MSSLTDATGEKTITLSSRAYERLARARKEGENFSDVILRLSSTKLFGLQKRGENEIMTSDDKKIVVGIDQDLCLGAESCVTLAPEVFALDESQLGARRKETEPLGMIDVEEKSVESEKIIRAAMSCPYRAIIIHDAATGAQICP